MTDRTNPFPTHGIVPNADDRNHLLIVDLSEPSPLGIMYLIDRLRNRESLKQIRDYCTETLEQRRARKCSSATEDEDPRGSVDLFADGITSASRQRRRARREIR